MATILLVDDERLIRRSVGRLLSRWHRVIIADSGEQALELLEDNPAVDIVLSDIMMPGMGGEVLYARLPEHLRSRVILMTGALNHRAVELFTAGVGVPILIKPFYLHELLDALSNVLSQGQSATL